MGTNKWGSEPKPSPYADRVARRDVEDHSATVTERRFPDMWIDPEDDPRESEAPVQGEKAVLSDYLDRYRTTLRLKCEGLTVEQLVQRSVPPSSLSLLGLVRHLARVEHSWFRRVLDGSPQVPRLYSDDGDVAFDQAVATPSCVREAWEAWNREVSFAQQWLAECPDLGAAVEHQGQPSEVRDIIVHMIEEYARHIGHADLLRECIDGRTGQ